MRNVHLKALGYFETVARLGTITKAAQDLSVSPSAISQQIRLLEEQFGVKLFRREKQRLLLTAEGDILFQTASHAFRTLRNTRDVIARRKTGQGISVRVSPSFGVRWLAPRIAEFSQLYPDRNLRVDATPEFSAFETEAIDCDLRYGLGGWAGLFEECLMNDFLLPLCSPDYRARHAQDVDAETAIQQANLIDSVKTVFRWDYWLASNTFDVPDLEFNYQFDRSTMSIEMAKQGIGVALESAALCHNELQRGELVPFLPSSAALEFPGYWFVCPPRHLNRRIVSQFKDWISKQLRAQEKETRALLKSHACLIRASAAG